MSVKLTGAPTTLPIGTPVKPIDLVAVSWATSERNRRRRPGRSLDPVGKPVARGS